MAQSTKEIIAFSFSQFLLYVTKESLSLSRRLAFLTAGQGGPRTHLRLAGTPCFILVTRETSQALLLLQQGVCVGQR